MTRRDFLKLLGAGLIMPLSGCIRAVEAPQLEAFDSGVRVVREVAEALTGEGRSILESYPLGSEIFLGILSLLPEPWRRCGVEWGISIGVGSDPKLAERLEAEELYLWCIEQYPHRSAGYEAILVGPPNGGIAHLAALLRAPFLTSSLVVSFRHPPIDADDVKRYYEFGARLTETIIRRNEYIETINHYDPLHDRALVKYVNRIRLRLLELPEIYREFMRKNLTPQGKIILIDCSYPWPQYLVSERAYLQVGGLGGITPEEFLKRWPLDLPLEVRRESEWGCPEGFASSVRGYAERLGVELLELRWDHPQHYSLLAYEAYLSCAGVRDSWVFFDCFNHQNPRTNIETGIPGVWLPFNTEDSWSFAEQFLKGRKFARIYLTLLPSFMDSPDTVALKRWVALMARHGPLRLVGIDPKNYPADPLAPFCLMDELKGLRQRYGLPNPIGLDLSALKELITKGEGRP
jgi:hypothetical protein